MKVLVLSHEGDGADVAYRMQEEGADVRLHIADKKQLDNFDGIVEKVKTWEPSLSWADFVLFDDAGTPEQRKAIIRAGKPCFGMGHSKKFFDMGIDKFDGWDSAEVLEEHRAFSHKLMEELEIGEPMKSAEFSSIPEAVAYLKDNPTPHVIKPECEMGDKGKTYVSEMEDGEDGVKWLETFPKRPGSGKVKKLEITERVNGVEVGVSAWFNGKRFIGPSDINFEHKKFCAGNEGHGLGFMTGEQGTVLYKDHRPFDECKLFQATLAKIEPFLSAMDYRGQLDVNCIVNEKGVYPLEFTPRLGYPSIYIEQEAQGTPWSELFYAIAKGEDIENKTTEAWCIGVLLCGEGYPFWDEGKKRCTGLPLLGVNKHNMEHLHLYDAKVDGEDLVATGSYPMCASANGKTLKEAQEMVYKQIIPSVFFSGMYYRDDIGNRVFEDVKKLNAWGWDIREP